MNNHLPHSLCQDAGSGRVSGLSFHPPAGRSGGGWRLSQGNDGAWRQIIDDRRSRAETSLTDMFSYAFVHGPENGWLSAGTCGPIMVIPSGAKENTRQPHQSNRAPRAIFTAGLLLPARPGHFARA
ncbi:hypothetical protein GCM10023212_26760 [Luteolibacter yonseiensis]